MQLHARLLRTALAFLVTLSWSLSATAQDDATSARNSLRLTIEPRAIYLAALEASQGSHAGVEWTMALHVPLEGPLTFVARARLAFVGDIMGPSGERDDSACGGGLSISLCFGDLDGRVPLGLELGLAWVERIADGTSHVQLGAELLASGTANVSFYETVATSGGVGGATNVFVDYIFSNGWGFGVAAGGRLEGPIGGPSFGAVHAGLRLSFTR